MAKMTNKKKKIFGWIALVIGFVFAYRYGTPKARFMRDARNIKTAWGAAVASSGQNPVDAVNGNIGNNTDTWKAYVAKGWAINQ